MSMALTNDIKGPQPELPCPAIATGTRHDVFEAILSPLPATYNSSTARGLAQNEDGPAFQHKTGMVLMVSSRPIFARVPPAPASVHPCPSSLKPIVTFSAPCGCGSRGNPPAHCNCAAFFGRRVSYTSDTCMRDLNIDDFETR